MRLLASLYVAGVLVLAGISTAAAKFKFTGLKNTQTISDLKEWKKLLKTRNNVLALFANGKSSVSDFLPMLEKVASETRGKGTLAFIDCGAEAKKMCRNLKMKPTPYALKHYKDGSFHKDYDRLMEEKSMASFILNPTADPPWSEDPSASNVRHIENPRDLQNFLRAEDRPILMFFYAPWCGHCKKMKPEMAAAADEVKGQYVLAGMDVDNPEAFSIREEYNITGFPTIVYFENGQKKYDYSGGRDKAGILEWLADPQPPEASPAPAEEEPPWSEVASDVVHLTSETFDSFIAENPSTLVMFYAPWCGHCKAMKPAYQEAAKTIKEQEIGGVLAAVDATKEEVLGNRFQIKGLPTLKYFGGEGVVYEYGYGREAGDLVDFMRSPREPPPPEKEWSEEESAVNHLTEETFKTTLKKKKHSLVMFYAPWCGHCKAAKPEYTAAAQHFSSDKKISFAAVDCTKFDAICKKHEVTGFPTFVYFNYGKNPSPYYGGRDQEGFVDFMSNPSAFTHSEL